MMKSRLFMITLALFFIMSCKKNSTSSTPPVVNLPPGINDFNPKTGATGTIVKFSGAEF